MEFLAHSENDLIAISKRIRLNSSHTLFLLIGDLGAGKTSFTKAFVKMLNMEDNVTSPTYSIINEYQSKDQSFYHIDLYRINSIQEALDIGIEDYLYSRSFCFVEWPQIIQSIIPNEHHTVEFHILDDDKRKIIFQ